MRKMLIPILLIIMMGACNKSTDNTQADASQVQQEWMVIFDGHSTEALRGYGIDEFPQGVWYVENGVLIANPDTANRDLITKARFKDFELVYEWAVDTASNSGVFFHMQEDLSMVADHGNSPNWLDNFEIQVLDDLNFHDTLSNRSAGALYDLMAPTNKQLKPIGEFNQARLIHRDGHVEHWLNGNKVLEFEIDSPEMKDLLASSKFKENPDYHSHEEGHIMFQHHGQKVYYRNIKVREL